MLLTNPNVFKTNYTLKVMEYLSDKKEIILNREPSELDHFAIKFISILQKYTDYVIISGYVSILLGRARATEDIDLFIKKITFEQFTKLYSELKKNGFWCLNAEDAKAVFEYIEEGLAVRFAKENQAIPNFEVKYALRKIDKETFEDFLTVNIDGKKLKISSLERQIAFKKYYLCSQKDLEDAAHIEELFKGKIDYEKINKLKKDIDIIREEENNA